MILIQKTAKGTINYLVNSENQFAKTTEELKNFDKSMPSLTELARMQREFGHTRQDMISNFERYMAKNTDHHKASFGGGLGEKFGFEYSAKNFELLKRGFWPGTKEDFERIYTKERIKNSITNKNLDLYSRLNKYTTLKKEQKETERKNKKIKYDVGLKLKESNGKLSLITQRPPKEVNGKTKGQTQEGESLVFGCPKGLSMLYAVADKRTQQIINKALDKAVEETMKEYALKLLPSTKDYQNKIDPSKTALLYASFDHIENRNVEPHKHRHIEVANFAEFTFKDGTKKILAPDTINVFTDRKELTSIFNTMLVSNLEKAGIKTKQYEDKNLGFSFQIVGIEREKEEKLINRKDEIKKYMEERKQKDKKDYKTIDLAAFDQAHTREMEEARKATQKSKSADLNSESLHSLIRETTEKEITFEEITQAQMKHKRTIIEFSEENIINMQKLEIDGQVSKQEIMAEIYNNLRFTKTFDSIETLRNDGINIYEKMIKEKLLVVKDNGKITSKQIIENEVFMLENFQKLKQEDLLNTNQLNLKEVREFNDRFKQFNPKGMNEDQIRACDELTKDKRLTVCIGSAGTGKTATFSSYANEFHTARGRKVFGLATQTITAIALAEAGIKDCFNIDTFLEQVKYGKLDIKNASLIIDEAGMVGTKHYRQLTDLAETHNLRLVLIGDDKQLASVSAGNAFSQVLSITQDYSTIDINMRQKNNIALEVAESFKVKNVDKAINLLSKNGLLHKAETTKEVNQKLVNDYMKDGSESKLIIAATNEEVNQLNDMIREKLKEQRTLEGKKLYKEQTIEVQQGDNKVLRNFSKDDEILFTKNMTISKDLKVLNGERGKIVSTRESVFTIELERLDKNKKPVQIKIDTKEHNHLNHAYATTTHKSQGKTVDSCFVKAGALTSSNAAYVNFSRHKHKVALYIETSNLEAFVKNSKMSQVKATTADDKNCQKIANEILEKRRVEQLIIKQTEKIKYQKPDIRKMQEKASRVKIKNEKLLKEQQEKQRKEQQENLAKVESIKQTMKSIELETQLITKHTKGLENAKNLSAELKANAEKEKVLKQSGPKFRI